MSTLSWYKVPLISKNKTNKIDAANRPQMLVISHLDDVFEDVQFQDFEGEAFLKGCL